MTSVALRSGNGVSCEEDQARESFFVAGALFVGG